MTPAQKKRRAASRAAAAVTSADIEADLAAFLARGGEITVVPTGVSGDRNAERTYREVAHMTRTGRKRRKEVVAT